MLQFLDFLAKTPQIDKVHDRTDNTAVFEYVSLAVGNFNKIRLLPQVWIRFCPAKACGFVPAARHKNLYWEFCNK